MTQENTDPAPKGRAWMLMGVGPAPWTYRWLPNGARHDPSGPGWAFRDGPGYRKPRTRQAAFAGACGRWLLRGQLGGTQAGAVIRRHEGHWHFLNGEWEGPYKWVYTGDHPERFAVIVPPVVKWVARYGRPPDLPARAFADAVR